MMQFFLPSLQIPLIIISLLITSQYPDLSAQEYNFSNYEECFVQNMKGSKSDLSVATISDACHKFFNGGANSRETKYARCVLKYFSGTMSDLTTGVVTNACTELYYANRAQLRPEDIKYNECLLEHAGQTSNELGIGYLQGICRDKTISK